MPNPRPNRQSAGFHIDDFTVDVIRREAETRSLSKSDTVDLIVKEWFELQGREVPKPTLVALHDSSTRKRVDELQRTVETLAQKVQTLTLRERLGKYSRS